MPLASENTHVVISGRIYELVPLHVFEAIAHADELTIEYPAPGERGWATADRRNPRESGLAAWFEGGAA